MMCDVLMCDLLIHACSCKLARATVHEPGRLGQADAGLVALGGHLQWLQARVNQQGGAGYHHGFAPASTPGLGLRMDV